MDVIIGVFYRSIKTFSGTLSPQPHYSGYCYTDFFPLRFCKKRICINCLWVPWYIYIYCTIAGGDKMDVKIQSNITQVQVQTGLKLTLFQVATDSAHIWCLMAHIPLNMNKNPKLRINSFPKAPIHPMFPIWYFKPAFNIQCLGKRVRYSNSCHQIHSVSFLNYSLQFDAWTCWPVWMRH